MIMEITLCGNIVDVRLDVRSMSKEALKWLQTNDQRVHIYS